MAKQIIENLCFFAETLEYTIETVGVPSIIRFTYHGLNVVFYIDDDIKFHSYHIHNGKRYINIHAPTRGTYIVPEYNFGGVFMLWLLVPAGSWRDPFISTFAKQEKRTKEAILTELYTLLEWYKDTYNKKTLPNLSCNRLEKIEATAKLYFNRCMNELVGKPNLSQMYKEAEESWDLKK
jgi:hypothetical protein